MVKIICDSTGDLTPDVIQKYGISLVPLNVLFGTDVFQDGVTITPEAFYAKLVTDSRHPTTSAPSPGQFAEIYQKLAKETDEIVVLTISGGLSATAESARQACELVGNSCKVAVVDSKMTCGGLFLPALKAAQMAQKGAKLNEIVDMLEDTLERVHAYMIFDTLDYLLKGGRIGRASAMLGSILKINPIITLKEGLVESVARARSREKAKDMLVQLVQDAGELEGLTLEDATTPAELDELSERVGKFVSKDITYRSKVSPVIGVHTGPNVLAACFISKK